MPKDNLTGTQKKLRKQTYKSTKEREKLGLESYKSGVKGLEEIQSGKGALTTDLSELQAQYEQAAQGAEKMFAEQKANTIAEHGEMVAPVVRGQYGAGAGQGSRSSALNQALAASQNTLSRGLSADYAQLRNQLAQNMMNMSQGNELTNLNARLQAISGQTGQGITPVALQNTQQATYLPKSGQPSLTKQLTGHLINAGVQAGATAIGGPTAGAVASQVTPMFTAKLTGGQQTPNFQEQYNKFAPKS